VRGIVLEMKRKKKRGKRKGKQTQKGVLEEESRRRETDADLALTDLIEKRTRGADLDPTPKIPYPRKKEGEKSQREA